MINFGELELRDSKNGEYSFVGIQKEGSKLIFHIPKGFSQSDSSLNTFDSKRDLFFRFYRMLNVFKQICIEKGYLKKNNQTNDRDGVLEVDTGSEITSDNDSKNIFYSKIDALGSILDAYDELKILGLVSRLGKSERLDYSKIHRFLNKAVFLNNGAIYIDAMNLPHKEIHFDATDIVAMYCYILIEIKEQLKLEVNSSEINSLAERFKEKYLGSEYSLFSEKYYLQVINDLKDALEAIDHYTPIKDSDYWDFYEAIYKFLFGDLDNSAKGKVWGFSNFYSIWESMCLTYLVKTVDPAFILYLDNQFISDRVLREWNNCNKVIDISKIFILKNTDKFSDKDTKLRPDAVIISDSMINNLKHSDTPISYKLKRGDHNDDLDKNNKWPDYYYKTQFGIVYEGKNNWNYHIAYSQQPQKHHTFDELKKIFPTDQEFITINSLPNNFYSYWNIPNELSSKEIQMMYNLNHVFFAYFKTEFLCFEEFYQELLKSDIFKCSLLKRFTDDKVERNRKFQKFIDVLQFKFSLIDIKYYNHTYFNSHENPEKIKIIEKIKRHSIRKQFLYEYLLQEHLKNTEFKGCHINSEFWLPAYSSEEKPPKYMDDYIKLTGVNIMTVIDSYLETEEK
jgi:hypothetical protein